MILHRLEKVSFASQETKILISSQVSSFGYDDGTTKVKDWRPEVERVKPNTFIAQSITNKSSIVA